MKTTRSYPYAVITKKGSAPLFPVIRGSMKPK